MTVIHMGRARTRDTAGQLATYVLAGLAIGVLIAFAIIGVRDTIRDLTEEPPTCTSVTFA